MPLVRARCPACTKPLGDPPHTSLPIACGACGFANTVRIGADGQPADFDVAFDPVRLGRWLASARVAMSRGAVGVAVGACARCTAALVVSSRARLNLPCPHCGVPVEGAAGALLVDQWPEPFALVRGGSIHVEYRLCVLEDRSDPPAGCASCGTATPASDPDLHCKRCGAITWIMRPGPTEDLPARRMQLAVRVDGTRAGQPFVAVMPIIQGEHALSRDLAQGKAEGSGSRIMGLTGVGCAAAIAASVLFCVLIAILVHFLG